MHPVKREETDFNAERKIFSIMNRRLTTDITVKELLDHYPKLLQAFLDFGLLCVGCPTEAFHTVEDVAKEYGYDPNKLIEHFEGIIFGTTKPS
jgi:hybrid cluster-associated redox disulfide protein